MSEDGANFKNAVTYNVENRRVKIKQKRLDNINKKLAEYDEKTNKGIITNEEIDNYNKLYDAKAKLEDELYNQRDYKNFVKLNNNIDSTDNENTEASVDNKSIVKIQNYTDENLKKSVEIFGKAQSSVDRKVILTIVNNLNIKIKEGAERINDTNMEKQSGKNKNPEIITITELFKNVTDKNAKTFREKAVNEALRRYRDTIAKIKDTDTVAEINKRGIEKTFSGSVTESKIQTADNILDIVEDGIYGFTTHDPNSKSGILYHHFFTPVKYKNNNGLIRVVIREYTKDNTLNDKFYYHRIYR